MAKKSKPIAQTVHIGRVNLIRFASKVVDKVFKNTVFRGKDVRDKQFKPYSKGYKKAKSGGRIKGQAGGPGKSSKPNLYLSGQMMRSLLVKVNRANEDNIPVGWVSGKSTQKLVWNESERGKNRKVSKSTGTFPFAPSVERTFFRDINKVLDKKVKKTSSKVVFKINM